MEQRIGSSSQPLDGAGVDPAYIPGLTSPASGTGDEPSDGDARRDADAEPEASAKPEAEPSDGPAADAEPDAEAAPAADADAEGGDKDDEDDVSDGPVFEAADRRARIVADAKGVRLTLDDQACEFRWDEIGAVETESPRFGKRFTVTVHTPDRRWYPIEIEAATRSRHKEWEARLDEVLDAYFDDGDDDDEPDEYDFDLENETESEKPVESEKPEEPEAADESGAADESRAAEEPEAAEEPADAEPDAKSPSLKKT